MSAGIAGYACVICDQFGCAHSEREQLDYVWARLSLAEEVIAAAQKLERTLADHFRPTSSAAPLACGSCQHRLRALREALANWDTGEKGTT